MTRKLLMSPPPPLLPDLSSDIAASSLSEEIATPMHFSFSAVVDLTI